MVVVVVGWWVNGWVVWFVLVCVDRTFSICFVFERAFCASGWRNLVLEVFLAHQAQISALRAWFEKLRTRFFHFPMVIVRGKDRSKHHQCLNKEKSQKVSSKDCGFVCVLSSSL